MNNKIDCYLSILRMSGMGFLVLVLTACQDPGSSDGVHTLTSSKPSIELRSDLIDAIKKQGFLISDGVCGKCSVKTIETSDSNTEIITIYRPDLSLRMMQAGSTAGSDAPLRFYLSGTEDGGSMLTYHQPSVALAIYDAPKIKPIAEELDGVFERIVGSLSVD